MYTLALLHLGRAPRAGRAGVKEALRWQQAWGRFIEGCWIEKYLR